WRSVRSSTTRIECAASSNRIQCVYKRSKPARPDNTMIPRMQFTNTGMVPPTRQAISNALWQMFRDAFGQDLNPDPRTPQGQLVASLTAALVDNYDSMIELGNQFDP